MKRKEMKMLLKSQQGELDAVLMYNALSKAVKLPLDSITFKRLAADEGRHATVFFKLTHKKLKPKKTKAILLPVLYRLLGRKRLYPLIAKGEYAALQTYAPIARKYPDVRRVRLDEKHHGDAIMNLL